MAAEAITLPRYRTPQPVRLVPIAAPVEGYQTLYGLPEMIGSIPLHDPHDAALDGVSYRLARLNERRVEHPVAQATPLQDDVHHALGRAWSNPFSERRQLHHEVLWAMADTRFASWERDMFWQELTTGDRHAALQQLAPNAVEFVALSRQAEKRVASDNNVVSRFVQQRVFRGNARDLAPLLYGYDEHEMAVEHHASLQAAQKRRPSARPQFALA